ncbi:MAG: tetratricopeptide repeat protein [Treponema sp.]|nr:tetratricopeptide repeat protein [Treponema sp.]
MNKKNKSFFLVLILIFSHFCFVYSQTTDVLSLYNRGNEYQNESSWYLAIQDYLEVVRINPAFSEAWYNLSECSYKLGEYDLALQYLKQAETLEKDNARILNLKGMILLALDRSSESKELFNSVLKKYPNDVDAHFGLAEIELLDGRYGGAELQYAEALKRSSVNRKAILSLAVLNAEKNNFAQSERYIRQALSYYSGDSEVHYIASIIYAMNNDYQNAEKQARISVEVDESNTQAYIQLANVLYKENEFNQVINICDYLISRDRNNSTAWYLKGISNLKLDNSEEAVTVWSTGLSVQPEDEIMRNSLEIVARDFLSLEDSRREYWAKYHLNKAKQYSSQYDGNGMLYEYQRALLLDPTNKDARYSYAKILELNGMYEFCLNQLKFIKEYNYEELSALEKTELNDKIEAYDSLLQNNLSAKWNIDTFYLDKTRWNIVMYYTNSSDSLFHSDIARQASLAASDIFSGVAITSIKTQAAPVAGYGEAFRNARRNNFDYFIILNTKETSEDITINYVMYSGRTGKEITNETFYGTGNNRFSSVLRRFRQSVLDKLTVRGKILSRNGNQVLVDFGKSENIQNYSELRIIKKGSVKTADSEVGLLYNDKDVLGTIKITNCGEEISEGIIENKGFYDRINIDDEVVLISNPSDVQNNSVDNVPSADANGNPITNNGKTSLINEIKDSIQKPSIVELLRTIY